MLRALRCRAAAQGALETRSCNSQRTLTTTSQSPNRKAASNRSQLPLFAQVGRAGSCERFASSIDDASIAATKKKGTPRLGVGAIAARWGASRCVDRPFVMIGSDA